MPILGSVVDEAAGSLPPVPTSNVHMANRLLSQQISLHVHSVKCIDENNGAWVERIGNDEIWLGGYSISATGDTAVIAPWGLRTFRR